MPKSNTVMALEFYDSQRGSDPRRAAKLFNVRLSHFIRALQGRKHRKDGRCPTCFQLFPRDTMERKSGRPRTEKEHTAQVKQAMMVRKYRNLKLPAWTWYGAFHFPDESIDEFGGRLARVAKAKQAAITRHRSKPTPRTNPNTPHSTLYDPPAVL